MTVDLDTITHACICGALMWVLDWVVFDDYEIAAYSLGMSCMECGNRAIAPTLVDKPEDGLDNYVTV